MEAGYQVFGEGEVPPPTALAGRRTMGGDELEIRKKVKGLGLALWGIWGSKHDQMTVRREHEANVAPIVRAATAAEGGGARTFSDLQRQETAPPSGKFAKLVALKPPRWRSVTDEKQAPSSPGSRDLEGGEEDSDTAPAMPEGHSAGEKTTADAEFYSPGLEMGESGVTGKRVFIEGLATPFSLRKEPDTASMITLQPSRPSTPGPNRLSFMEAGQGAEKVGEERGVNEDLVGKKEADGGFNLPTATPGCVTPVVTPGLLTPGGRPEPETFVTAEEVPRATSTVGSVSLGQS